MPRNILKELRYLFLGIGSSFFLSNFIRLFVFLFRYCLGHFSLLSYVIILFCFLVKIKFRYGSFASVHLPLGSSVETIRYLERPTTVLYNTNRLQNQTWQFNHVRLN